MPVIRLEHATSALRAVLLLGLACAPAGCGSDTTDGRVGGDAADTTDGSSDTTDGSDIGGPDAGTDGSSDTTDGSDIGGSDAGTDGSSDTTDGSDIGGSDVGTDGSSDTTDGSDVSGTDTTDGSDVGGSDVGGTDTTDGSDAGADDVGALPDPAGVRVRETWVGVSGLRDYALYTPASPAPDGGRPVILALHGCDQTPESFLDGSRLEALAEREGAIVIAPEQPVVANPLRCWNWFVAANQTRALGEGAQLVALMDDVADGFDVDPSQVHVTGISAGGSMAAILLACHPDRFASGMIVAGVPYAAAADPATAVLVMDGGPAVDPVPLGDLAWVCGGRRDVAPRVLVVHGDADDVVNPRNGVAIIDQFARVHDHVDDGVTGSPPVVVDVEAPRGLADAASRWRAVDEAAPRLGLLTADGLGHAWPGGDERYPYAVDGGPSATGWAGWWFFGR